MPLENKAPEPKWKDGDYVCPEYWKPSGGWDKKTGKPVMGLGPVKCVPAYMGDISYLLLHGSEP